MSHTLNFFFRRIQNEMDSKLQPKDIHFNNHTKANNLHFSGIKNQELHNKCAKPKNEKLLQDSNYTSDLNKNINPTQTALRAKCMLFSKIFHPLSTSPLQQGSACTHRGSVPEGRPGQKKGLLVGNSGRDAALPVCSRQAEPG